MKSSKIKKLLSDLFQKWVSRFGRQIIDERTGQEVARVVVRVRKGRIEVVGLRDSRPLVARFVPPAEASYTRASIAFESHEEPDFPNERNR
ncbi:MAG: hypothetical protein AAGA58_14180 [Verrucomicrobiota bacterium]